MAVIVPPVREKTNRIRVLVVDDSALMRKFVSEILAEDPDIEVIAAARDGEDALDKARSLCPDVITLDVEMPRMSGIAFLEALLPEQRIPVVMLSSLTTKGAETTFACLQRGAVDFVAKPSGSISLDLKRCSEEIRAKVRGALHARVRVGRLHTPVAPPLHPQPIQAAPPEPFHRSAPPETARPVAAGGAEVPAPATRRIDTSTRVVAIAS